MDGHASHVMETLQEDELDTGLGRVLYWQYDMDMDMYESYAPEKGNRKKEI